MKMSCEYRVSKTEIKAGHQRTDSNKVCAECPKTKENPRMIVASGTSDAMVLLLLKISRQMKVKTRRTHAMSTASSFATALPTS